MTKIGYHISHEQFSPADLLQYAVMAEEAGFQFAISSDHFHSWSPDQGHAGFAWSWLGAGMARTTIPFGVVNCPFFRYHPAIIAQAVATLDVMFPGRFFICVGSGQAMNEAITGEHWPPHSERNERLKEAVDIMRALWKGETLTHRGHLKVEEAQLYTRPTSKIQVVGAAVTAETAAWLAGWADALITISQPAEKLQKIVDAWKSNGGENKPMKLKVQLSYDQTEEKALKGAHEQWRTNIFSSRVNSQLRTPQDFKQMGERVQAEEMYEYVNISPDPAKHIEWIKQYESLGFTEIDLHNVNKNQEPFIQAFGKDVLPHFKVES